ncbi:MAG TPA: hypothetical protein VKF41_10425, partial [Bryobacteraceae bacterium]|nr:hypothetical protein [Bryobacteraceae bacterium]
MCPVPRIGLRFLEPVDGGGGSGGDSDDDDTWASGTNMWAKSEPTSWGVKSEAVYGMDQDLRLG